MARPRVKTGLVVMPSSGAIHVRRGPGAVDSESVPPANTLKRGYCGPRNIRAPAPIAPTTNTDRPEPMASVTMSAMGAPSPLGRRTSLATSGTGVGDKIGNGETTGVGVGTGAGPRKMIGTGSGRTVVAAFSEAGARAYGSNLRLCKALPCASGLSHRPRGPPVTIFGSVRRWGWVLGK